MDVFRYGIEDYEDYNTETSIFFGRVNFCKSGRQVFRLVVN